MKTFYQFYEEMMAANAAGASGGFSADSPAAGPTAGKETPMGKVQKRKKVIGLGPGSRKRWMGEETVDEGLRLKSWDEWKAGAAAAGDRLNKNVIQPLKNLVTPKSQVTKLKVTPYQYKKGDSTETDARNNALKSGPLRSGDVYIKRSPGDGLPKIKLNKDNQPKPGQYGVE
jgi:hypothetical protein